MKLISDGKQYLPVDDPQGRLFLNEPIKRYLDARDRDEIFFLVGPKGIGKTTLLRQKSHLYRQKPGIKFNANSNELVEYISAPPASFSKAELLHFTELDLWERIWRYTLRLIALKTADPPDLSRETKDALKGPIRISSLLQDLLSGRDEIYRKLDKFESILTQDIGRVQSGVAIFIDNVDQAFDRILRKYHYSDDYFEGNNSPAAEFWVNAQIGLLSSAYDLNCDISHIKVFATCRREAYELLPGTLKSNIENYTTKLEYSKEEIKNILELKLQEMGIGKIEEGKSVLLGKYLGFEKRPHPIIQDPETKQQKMEDPFEYLYRHTFGRPREIVILLQQLHDKVISLPDYHHWDFNKKLDSIRDVVNLAGREFFEWYQEEIVPHFDKEKLSEFIKLLRTNLIEKEETGRFDRETMKAYYVYGLLGHTIRKPGHDNLVQKFLPVARYNYRSFSSLPPEEYYLIHPAMDQTVIDMRGYDNHYNKINIIGDGYPFILPQDYLKKSGTEDISWYLPTGVHSGRWDKGYPNYKHDLPLKEYYLAYFSKYESLGQDLRKKFDLTFSALVRFHYYTLLRNQFGKPYESSVNESYSLLFKQLQLKKEYQTALTEASESNYSIFYNRIFGRLLLLGCHLFLHLECSKIHSLMVAENGDYLNAEDSAGKTKFQYLRTAFYVEGLRDDSEHPEKDYIFGYLSPFEQNVLREWSENLKNIPMELTFYAEPGHREWLIGSGVLKNFWMPKS